MGNLIPRQLDNPLLRFYLFIREKVFSNFFVLFRNFGQTLQYFIIFVAIQLQKSFSFRIMLFLTTYNVRRETNVALKRFLTNLKTQLVARRLAVPEI